MFRFFLLYCLLLSQPVCASFNFFGLFFDPLSDFNKFAQSVDDLPRNRDITKDNLNGYSNKHIVTLKYAGSKLQETADLYAKWIKNTPQTKEFRGDFVPFYVARLTLPADAKIVAMGDCHGDAKSIIATLRRLNEENKMDGFKIIDPKLYLLFLGDFVDRGLFGLEVLAIISHLKILNQEQVLLVRGNHEDFYSNESFRFELAGARKKEGLRNKHPIVERFAKAYQAFCNNLPVALFLKIGEQEGHILAVHGGIERRHNPKELLGSPYASVIETLEYNPWCGDITDYQWLDFTLDPNEESGFCEAEHRGRISKKDTDEYLKEHNIIAVLRGHQHTASAASFIKEHDGILHHWHEPEKMPKLEGIFTFNQGADSFFCEFHKLDKAVSGSIQFDNADPKEWVVHKHAEPVPGITPGCTVQIQPPEENCSLFGFLFFQCSDL